MLCAKFVVPLLLLSVAQIDSVHPKFVKYAIAPRDLSDDVEAQLYDFGQLVLGKILVAHDELDTARFEVTSHGLNIRLSAEVTAESQRQAFEVRLTTLKELGMSAQQNISSCLDGNEEKLNDLPDTHLTAIKKCITTKTDDSDTVTNDARYNVDVLINEVQRISFALGKCNKTDEDCLNIISDEIKDAAISVPEKIDVFVRSAQTGLELVKAEIVDCRDNGVADLVYEGSKILSEITSCVQDIISKDFQLKVARILFLENHNKEQ